MPLQQINVSPLEWKQGDTGWKQEDAGWKQEDAGIAHSVAHTSGQCTSVQDNGEHSDSQSSSLSSTCYDICRICHCEGDNDVPLIAPCYCAGSLRYVHQACLQQWIKSSNIRSCELCKFQFIMQTKTKPFSEWEYLEMSGFERRKLLCAIMFHAVALTCVVWSLYVLIDRTAEEIQKGLLEWPFWTKLIVVAIGFTGGVVFMYIQCKAYLQICQRWKAFNRVIYVQNAPEKPNLPSPSVLAPLPPSQQQISASHSRGDTSAVPPTTSDSQFKPYQDRSREINLHIFFNDENIRVQNDESCRIDMENSDSDVGEGNVNSHLNGQRTDSESVGTSWHIKIGKSKDAVGKGNDLTMSSSSHRYNNDESFGSIVSPSENSENMRRNNGNDTIATMKCNDLIGNGMNDSPVLKLQIKKAEIVIKFGQKGNSTDNTPITTTDDKPSDDRSNNDASLNIKIDSREKDRSDPIVIDVVQNSHQAVPPAPEHTDSSNPVQIRLDFRNDSEVKENLTKSEPGSPTSKLLSEFEASVSDVNNALSELQASKLCDDWDTNNVAGSEPGSGSQSPLLSNKVTKDDYVVDKK